MTDTLTVEHIKKALTMLESDHLPKIPSKAFARKMYLDYMKSKIPSKNEPHSSLMGFPVYIDEHLPYPVMLRVVNMDGEILSEIHAPTQRR